MTAAFAVKVTFVAAAEASMLATSKLTLKRHLRVELRPAWSATVLDARNSARR